MSPPHKRSSRLPTGGAHRPRNVKPGKKARPAHPIPTKGKHGKRTLGPQPDVLTLAASSMAAHMGWQYVIQQLMDGRRADVYTKRGGASADEAGEMCVVGSDTIGKDLHQIEALIGIEFNLIDPDTEDEIYTHMWAQTSDTIPMYAALLVSQNRIINMANRITMMSNLTMVVTTITIRVWEGVY